MIFLISPSKTMVKGKLHSNATKPLFERDVLETVKELSLLDIEETKGLFQISEKLAKENIDRLKHFGKDKSSAIYSYTGYQYKNIDALSLDESSMEFLQNHLYILSGLYGLLRPMDAISLYRLPMETVWNGVRRSQHFKDVIAPFLNKDLIINLMSQEYAQALPSDLNRIDIQFYYYKKDQLKIDSMEAKKMRGLFLRYVSQHKIDQVEDLIKFKQFGYTYDKENSNSNQIVFIRKVF